MEFVWLSTEQLNLLGKSDEVLGPYFKGTSGCDQLPSDPQRDVPQAYIVNTDPSHLPGQHWLGIWTYRDTCEVMDSYGLPLHSYPHIEPLEEWLKQWSRVHHSRQTLQSINTASCGDYALIYLMCKARGMTLRDFLKLFSNTDYVSNDARVGDILEQLVRNEIKEITS